MRTVAVQVGFRLFVFVAPYFVVRECMRPYYPPTQQIQRTRGKFSNCGPDGWWCR